MQSTIDALFLVLLLTGPVAGYSRATRRPGATRGQLVLGATLGGAVVGALLVPYLAFAPPPVAPGSTRFWMALPYGLAATAGGAVLGLCGVLARAVGAWLARRP